VAAIVGLALHAAGSGRGVLVHPGPGPAGSARFLVVGAAGSDRNPCTVARPCQTIDHAVRVSRPGDEVWLAEGSYPEQRIGGTPNGPVVVRVPRGVSATVQGIFVERGLVTLDSLTVAGSVTFTPAASGSSLVNSRARGFHIFGADDIAVMGNVLDGEGIVGQNIIWDEPAGNTPDRWRIVANTLQNFYLADPTSHSEALYVGYSTNGLIEGNRFVNNGSTSHVFFTWFGNRADPTSSYPRSICVKRNRFGMTHSAFWAISLREEIPASAGIRIDQANASVSGAQFRGKC
jgi:hypothetical protein